MEECDICHLDKVTWDLSEEEVSKLISEVSALEQTENKQVELPSIVPIISLKYPSSFCWDSIHTSAVIVEYGELIQGELLTKVAEAGDIHTHLNFDGKVLLSSIMPDELLMQQDTFNYFTKLTKWFGFDATIAWDAPVYADIPLYDSWINLLKGLLLTCELAKGGIPVIGLVKGNADKQIEFSAKMLAKSGIKSMALHASEYMPMVREDGATRQILYTYFRNVSKWADSVLVIGVMKPSSLSFLMGTFHERPKPSVAGLSWFLDAEKGFLYSNRGFTDATSKFVECTCTTCAGIPPCELMAKVGARAKHNLNYISNLYSGAMSPDMQTRDLILSEKETAFFISDIHLWVSGSLLDELIAFLRNEKPTYVVFVGDTFDLKWGVPDLAEASMLFRVLRETGTSVLVVKGCTDGDQEEFLSALDVFTMGGKPKPMLWAKPDDEDLQQTLLDLYRFYRSAKERLEIKLANGELVIAEHGHRIVPDPSKPIDAAIERMGDARSQAGADWLITGHLHKAFIDEDRRVASAGCWTVSGPREGMRISKEDVRTSIAITGYGKIEIKRRS